MNRGLRTGKAALLHEFQQQGFVQVDSAVSREFVESTCALAPGFNHAGSVDRCPANRWDAEVSPSMYKLVAGAGIDPRPPIRGPTELRETLLHLVPNLDDLSLLSRFRLLTAGGVLGCHDWHQDCLCEETAGHDSLELMLTVWIALFDVPIDGGCLQVLPGRQQLGRLPHERMGDGWFIRKGFLDLNQAIQLPCSAGTAIIMDPMLPHASGPNRKSVSRLALSIWLFRARFPA